MKYAIITALLLASTARATPQTPVLLPQSTLTLTSGTTAISVQAEIAATENARHTGLMYRDSLCDTCGMLLAWSKPGETGMWMRNTRIPLDMLFIRKDTVVAVHANAQPYDETIIMSPPDITGVLEVNGGWAAKNNITPGWRITRAK